MAAVLFSTGLVAMLLPDSQQEISLKPSSAAPLAQLQTPAPPQLALLNPQQALDSRPLQSSRSSRSSRSSSSPKHPKSLEPQSSTLAPQPSDIEAPDPVLTQRFLAQRSAEQRRSSTRRAVLQRLAALTAGHHQESISLDSQPQLRAALEDLRSSGRDPQTELARLEALEKLDPKPGKPRDDAVDSADVQLQILLQPTQRGAVARAQLLLDLARFPGPTGLVALLRYDPALHLRSAQPGRVASATAKILRVTERAPGQALLHLTGSTQPLSYGCIAELEFDVDLNAPDSSELAVTEVLIEGLAETSISARAATLALGALPR